MRKFFWVLAVASAVVALPTAQAASDPNVSLAVSKFHVGYGKAVHLAGRVSSRTPGVSVLLLARSFTRSGFVPLASVTTGQGGRWSYDARPSIATTYLAKTGKNTSRTLMVGVRPALSIRSLPSGRVQVHAAAARAFSGRTVKLQQLTSGGWSTLARLRLNARSTALVPRSALPNGKSTLRATMSVNQAGVGYLGGFSRPIVVAPRWVSLALSSPEIVHGGSVTLAGRVSIKQPGLALAIRSRSLAKPEFQQLATVRPGSAGKWSLRVSPKIGTAYQAQFRGAKSHVVAVGVHPTIRARIISGGRLSVDVVGGRSFRGADIRVQQLSDGRWTTVAKQSLNHRSEAVFPVSMLPGGTSTMRVAMSVNQAGVGYLGAASRTFVYQR